MRLVLIYYVTDGMTYSNEVVVPIEEESKEALYCALKDRTYEAYKAYKDKCEIMLYGHEFDAFQFWSFESGERTSEKGTVSKFEGDVYEEPEILTIDEWFERK